jgi:WD40 repeat protein
MSEASGPPNSPRKPKLPTSSVETGDAYDPTEEEPSGLFDRTIKWARRRPAAALGVVLMLTITVGFAVATWQWLGAATARNAAEGEKKDAEKERDAVRLQLAISERDRGLILCHQGDVRAGLLFLARALQSAPADAVDLQRSLRLQLAAWCDRLAPVAGVIDLDSEFGPALAVSFTPDGKTLLSSHPRVLVRWDLTTGKPVGPPVQQNEPGLGILCSPDSETFLTFNADSHQARLYKTDTLALTPLSRAELPQAEEIHALAYSRDGKTVFTGGTDKTVRRWDAATGKEIEPSFAHDALVKVIELSPDGKTLLATGLGRVTLWDTATFKPLLAEPLEFEEPVVSAAFQPDGKSFLVLLADGTIYRRDTAKGMALGEPVQLSQKAIASASWSPDKKRLLTVGARARVAQLWEAETGKVINFLPHRQPIYAASFGPNNHLIVTLCGDGDGGLVQLWDGQAGLAFGPPLARYHASQQVAISADGKLIVTGQYTSLLQWQVPAVPAYRPPPPTPPNMRSASFSADLQKVLVLNDTAQDPDLPPEYGGNVVRLLATATGQPLGPLLPVAERVFLAVLHPDGKTAVTHLRSSAEPHGPENLLRFWDATTGTPTGTAELVEGTRFLSLSYDGKQLLTKGPKGIERWDTATGKRVEPSVPLANTAMMHRDGNLLVTGDDKNALLWNPATGQLYGPPLAHKHGVRAIAISPDGRRLFTSSFDKKGYLWDTKTGKLAGSPWQFPTNPDRAVLNTDGSLLATADYAAKVQLWETATGKPLGPPLALTALVEEISFQDGGKTLVTACRDLSIQRWPLLEPMAGSAEEVMLRMQTLTGMELTGSYDVAELDAAVWRHTRQRWQALAGIGK